MSDIARIKRLVCEEIDNRGDEIVAVARDILAHPEPGFRETRTARVAADRLRGLGMAPKEGIALTGVKARLEGGSAGPNVAVMGELDSLIVPGHPDADPETGAAHACGHHCQIGSMLAAATGLSAAGVMDELSGNITFIAVPAEEYIEIEWRNSLRLEGKLEFLGGKPEFVRLGELDDIDMAMMTHTGSGADSCLFGIGSSSTGIVAKLMRFTGVSAHAGGAPHMGVNALNAAHIALAAIHAQRETFKDSDVVRVHPIITRGGSVVNAVPADVRMETFVRAAGLEAMMDANAKVDRSLRAGALATGASVTITTLPGYMPLRQSEELVELHRANAAELVGDEHVVRHGLRGGSTDMGDVSQLMPAIHPYAGGVTGTSHGDNLIVKDYGVAVLAAAKAMAMTIVDLLADGAAKGQAVLKQFEPAMTKAGYLEHMRSLQSENTYTE